MVRSLLRGDWLTLWILWAAWCGVAGWALSGVGALDRLGYAASTFLFLLGAGLQRRFWLTRFSRPVFLLRCSTFRRTLPRLWVFLAFLAFVGGLLYHPDNFDYLTYRFPRLLHWTWAHHWYWLDTPSDRQNLSAVGMEWLMAPIFLFTRTDRFFFLINFVSYLFMPGLVFSVFRGLGITGRIAWWWMWILPVGFCYILQAASMGNDAFAAVFLLAAFHYGLKAGAAAPEALALSILSMALLTGAKASNLPLVVPWLALLWLRREPVFAAMRPLLLTVTCAAAILCSFLPIAVANIRYTGSYTGDPHNGHGVEISEPLIGVAGNWLEVMADNLAPPMWPHPINWHVPGRLEMMLKSGYPRFELVSTPLQFEESAGLGLAASACVLLCALYGIGRRIKERQFSFTTTAMVLLAATGIAWLGYMSKLGSEAVARLVAPYYVMTIAALLLAFPFDGAVTRTRWWRAVGIGAMAVTFPLLILNPSRPLLPVSWIGAGLHLASVPSASVEQLIGNYRLRESRRDGLAALRDQVPATEKVMGLLSGSDDPPISFWLPFGSRDVINVYPATTDFAARQIHYVAVSGPMLAEHYRTTLPALLRLWPMRVVAQQEVQFKTKREHETWYLLKLR